MSGGEYNYAYTYGTGTSCTGISGSIEYTINFRSSRPSGPYLLATDAEREDFLDRFEGQHGKLTKKQRKALKATITGWAVQ